MDPIVLAFLNKPVSRSKISDDVLSYGWSRFYGLNQTPSNPLEPSYIQFLFDTQGYSIPNNSDVVVSSIVMPVSNVKSAHFRIAINNTADVNDVLTSGNNNYLAKASTNVAQQNKPIAINYTYSGLFSGTYRYVKAMVCCYPIDPAVTIENLVRSVTVKVGGVELPCIGIGCFINSNRLTIDYSLPVGFLRASDVLGNRWHGKKANFLGDSITSALYYNGSAYVSPVKPYHAWIKEKLSLSVVRNYGFSGTHISATYTDDANTADPSLSFTNRYSSMDNDADLVVVFGGTNDYGHSATAPIGTAADATDISFYGALNVLYTGLINKYPASTIVVALPLHRTGETTANPTTGLTLKQYVDIIKERASYYGIATLDLYSGGGLNLRLASHQSLYGVDGLHPNEAGHALLGNKFAGFISTL